MVGRWWVGEAAELSLLIDYHGDDDGSGAIAHHQSKLSTMPIIRVVALITFLTVVIFSVPISMDIGARLVKLGTFPPGDDDGSSISEKIPTTIFDLVIYHATPAGCAAAIAAAEMGSTVLIIEPSNHVGGMATEGGIGLRDGLDQFRIQDPRNSQVRWGKLNAAHYGLNASHDVIWQPDSYVGEESLRSMLNDAGVEVRYESNTVEGSDGVIVEDTANGDRLITGLRLEGRQTETIFAKFIVDASYEGDLMIAAGVSYTFGREASSTYNEYLAGIRNESRAQFPLPINPYTDASPNSTLLKYIQDLPDPREHVGEAGAGVMAYSYRVCLTKDHDNSVAIGPPPRYDPSDFELLRRLLTAEIEHNLTISTPWMYLEYMNYDKIISNRQDGMKFDACCGTSPFSIDNPTLSWGYANASRAKRKEIAEEHRYYVHGLLWFWRSDPAVPEDLRVQASEYGFCLDEFADNGHFPRQLYVREAARMVGERVFTQNDRIQTCRNDSIAVATWFFDIHDVSRVAVRTDDSTRGPSSAAAWMTMNEGLVVGDADSFIPFDLPYWTILPERSEIANLAVVNCPSVSHVAFSAIREEPTLWALGHAAGIAAAMAASNNLTSFHDVDIQELQTRILEQGGRLHFPSNSSCWWRDTIQNE